MIPYPLNCPITVFGARDDERVRPEHMKEWGRLSRGNNKHYLCESGGYLYFRDPANEQYVRDKVCNICRGIEEAESKVTSDDGIESVEKFDSSSENNESDRKEVSEELS